MEKNNCKKDDIFELAKGDVFLHRSLMCWQRKEMTLEESLTLYAVYASRMIKTLNSRLLEIEINKTHGVIISESKTEADDGK